MPEKRNIFIFTFLFRLVSLWRLLKIFLLVLLPVSYLLFFFGYANTKFHYPKVFHLTQNFFASMRLNSNTYLLQTTKTAYIDWCYNRIYWALPAATYLDICYAHNGINCGRCKAETSYTVYGFLDWYKFNHISSWRIFFMLSCSTRRKFGMGNIQPKLHKTSFLPPKWNPRH